MKTKKRSKRLQGAGLRFSDFFEFFEVVVMRQIPEQVKAIVGTQETWDSNAPSCRKLFAQERSLSSLQKECWVVAAVLGKPWPGSSESRFSCAAVQGCTSRKARGRCGGDQPTPRPSAHEPGTGKTWLMRWRERQTEGLAEGVPR